MGVGYLTVQLGNCRRIEAAKAIPQYPKPKIKTCFGSLRPVKTGGSSPVFAGSTARCRSNVRGWIEDKNALVRDT